MHIHLSDMFAIVRISKMFKSYCRLIFIISSLVQSQSFMLRSYYILANKGLLVFCIPSSYEYIRILQYVMSISKQSVIM